MLETTIVEQVSGTNYKRSKVCVCGARKFKGTPFCSECWSHVTEEARSRLRPATGPTYDAIFEEIVLGFRSEKLIGDHSAQPVYQSKASVDLPAFTPPRIEKIGNVTDLVFALRVNRAQMERLFLGATVEDQAAALNYLLENDRLGSAL